MKDIPVLHLVVPPFQPHLAHLFRAGLALAGDEIVIGDGFRRNETAFEIGMDDTGCLRRGCTDADRPGAGFFRADGEEGDLVQQLVTGANDLRQAGFLQPERFQKFDLFFRRAKLRDLGFDSRRNDHAFRPLRFRLLDHPGRIFVAGRR